MNQNFFLQQMTGQWIVQSTNYSLQQDCELTQTFMKQIIWTHISNHKKDLEFILSNLNLKYKYNNISLYTIEAIDNSLVTLKYYIVLLYETSQKAYMLKFNEKFNFINKFVIQYYSNYHLSIISKNKNITIVEKIYFLNSNLKVIKSIIKKHKKYIGISFSSEIRIS